MRAISDRERANLAAMRNYTGRYDPSTNCRGQKGMCAKTPTWKVQHRRRRDFYCDGCLPKKYKGCETCGIIGGHVEGCTNAEKRKDYVP